MSKEGAQAIIRAKAPLRVSFAGGGTDVPPYCDNYGGCVLNATINKYAYSTLQPNLTGKIEVHSLDYDYIAHFQVDDKLPLDGEMDLLKAVINRLKRDQRGVSLMTHNDAPPGSGLGSSSAMVVSLVGAFNEWHGLGLSDYEIANLALEIERVDLAISGGKQDQYACTFGGFNFMEFGHDYTLVNPLRIKKDVINELEYNLLLYYTGKSRLSGNIIDAQVKNVNEGKQKSLDAMHDLKQQTLDMKNALLRGQTHKFGELLHSAWESKKNMADEISNPLIDEMYDTARRAGAIGGKVSGAGGGGFMTFYCANGKKNKVAESLERLGGEVVDFQFELNGLQSWRVG